MSQAETEAETESETEAEAETGPETPETGPETEAQARAAPAALEEEDEPTPPRSAGREWGTPLVLFALTFASTLWVGAPMATGEAPSWDNLWQGWTFAVPLMAILLSHEMGHYVAGRIHGVDISPPYFIPMPLFLLGTMGAVIRMRGAIRTRDALLDIGAAGPIAGMVVALPVLAYGLHVSPIETLAEHADEATFTEGRGLLYLAMLYLIKGPLAEGTDVWLGPTAMAGWAGLLVTQINLVPVGQLDGGHVAYALFGERQDRYSRWIHRALPVIGVTVSLAYLVPAYLGGERGEALEGEAMAGLHWIVWGFVLFLLMRFSGDDHPPTGPEPLSPSRRWVAVGTLLLFAVLFMPSWIYVN